MSKTFCLGESQAFSWVVAISSVAHIWTAGSRVVFGVTVQKCINVSMSMPYWSPSVSIHTCFIRSSLALNVPPPPDLLLCSRYRVSAKFVMLLHQLIYDCILQPTSLTFGLLVCLPDLSQSHHTPNLQSSTCSAICNARPSTIHSISTPAAIWSQCQPGLNSCLWVTKMSLTLTELGEMGVKEVKGANEPVELQHVDLWFAGFSYTKINVTAILKTASRCSCFSADDD